MTNDNVDNGNQWYMPQGPFVNYLLWKMTKSQISITDRITNCHKFKILSFSSMFSWWQVLSTRRLPFHTSQNPRWLTVSTSLTSQNKQFLTIVWVFGLWQLIMLTVKCYGYKIPSMVIFKNFGCERWWNVPNRNSYNCTPQQNIKRCYYSML